MTKITNPSLEKKFRLFVKESKIAAGKKFTLLKKKTSKKQSDKAMFSSGAVIAIKLKKSWQLEPNKEIRGRYKLNKSKYISFRNEKYNVCTLKFQELVFSIIISKYDNLEILSVKIC